MTDSITLEMVYEKLVELTEICEQGFIDMRTHLSVLAGATARIAKRVGELDKPDDELDWHPSHLPMPKKDEK